MGDWVPDGTASFVEGCCPSFGDMADAPNTASVADFDTSRGLVTTLLDFEVSLLMSCFPAALSLLPLIAGVFEDVMLVLGLSLKSQL